MKKIFTLLCVALAAVSCIDDDYDLGKVETGNITIGGDQTAFEMPLAQIVIGMTELRNGSSDVKAIFEEADIWLPSTLPGGTAYADIRRLTSASDSYLDQTVDLLFDEMAASQAKMDEVTDLIWRTPEYRNRFSEVISADEEALFKALFREYFSDEETGKVLRDLSGELARDYLSGIRVETVNYRIEGIDLGSDVVDMLVDNLDPEGTADPRNTLQIYGSVTSALPLSLQTSPTFTGTAIRMEPFAVGRRTERRSRNTALRAGFAAGNRRRGDRPPARTAALLPRPVVRRATAARPQTAPAQTRRPEYRPLNPPDNEKTDPYARCRTARIGGGGTKYHGLFHGGDDLPKPAQPGVRPPCRGTSISPYWAV